MNNFVATLIMMVFPRSTEDWKVGDLAVCIDDRFPSERSSNPKKNDLLRVTAICWDQRFLHFSGKPEDYHWSAICFRKVKPDTTPADDAEWVDQLRHLRRTVPA